MFFYYPALANRTYYAHITQSNTYFFSEPTDTETSKMFVLPQTYFVELLDNANDLFYSARYSDLYGYVLKSQIKPTSNIPSSPFLENINFRVFVPSGADLRSSPYCSGTLNLIYSIPFLDNNISYYGIMNGEECISKKGNVWYYCKYYCDNNSYSGYVYSALCDCLTSFSNNTETVEYLQHSELTFKPESSPTVAEPFEGLSQTATTIIIIVISLPCLLLIYLLFKPSKIAEQQEASSKSTSNKKQNKKKITRLKHSDYFEFDDDF